MKVKKYRCSCGCNDFFFLEKEPHIGIYCSDCGTFYKWANKNEKNLYKKSILTTRMFEKEDN